nr:hypothetical protein [Tanacetum cinerariifolium]
MIIKEKHARDNIGVLVIYATCTLQNGALTWWNSHKRTVGTDATYAMKWKELMKLMTEVYYPRNKIQKMDSELWNLTVKGNVTLFVPTRIQDAIRMASSLMDQKNSPANIDFDAGPSYDYAFLSEVQTPSTSYVNPLFAKDDREQQYSKQPKIINNAIGDDQIDSNIIFDEPNNDVNSSSVKDDTNAQQSYKLEKFATNAYKEAEKQ